MDWKTHYRRQLLTGAAAVASHVLLVIAFVVVHYATGLGSDSVTQPDQSPVQVAERLAPRVTMVFPAFQAPASGVTGRTEGPQRPRHTTTAINRRHRTGALNIDIHVASQYWDEFVTRGVFVALARRRDEAFVVSTLIDPRTWTPVDVAGDLQFFTVDGGLLPILQKTVRVAVGSPQGQEILLALPGEMARRALSEIARAAQARGVLESDICAATVELTPRKVIVGALDSCTE